MSRVWVLADPAPGHAGQALGVAEALGEPFAVKTLAYTKAAALPNVLRGASRMGLTAESKRALAPPWPDLVIAAGRRTAPVARWIKRQAPGARLVQILHPGQAGLAEFDLVAVPRHDRAPPAANLLPILGVPHRVTEEKLAEAAKLWASNLRHYKRPFLAVLVGGATRRRPFTGRMAADLVSRLAALKLRLGGSFLVTLSRRTPPEVKAALEALLPHPRLIHDPKEGGENPYFGFLALADAVVVTGDSVSMLCEAAATQAPVHLFAPEGWVTAKHARLHDELIAGGYIQRLDGRAMATKHPPLNAAKDVAQAIRDRFS
jgi:mitochondrial fission protein ELM1